MSAKAEKLEIIGQVVKVHGSNQYDVELELGGTKRKVLCYLSGKMKTRRINVLEGDKVKVDVAPPFDRGRIVFREKN